MAVKESDRRMTGKGLKIQAAHVCIEQKPVSKDLVPPKAESRPGVDYPGLAISNTRFGTDSQTAGEPSWGLQASILQSVENRILGAVEMPLSSHC